MRGHRDLRLVVALTAICAAGSLVEPLGAVRVIFAVPLTLLLPGYAVAAAIFGGRLPRRAELLPLTVGLSLAVLALGSLLLNYTPGGIRGLPWVLLLSLLTLACCRVAAVRRAPAAGLPPFRRPHVSPSTAICAAGAVAAVAAALILAQTTLHADRALGYAELWIAPPTDTTPVVRVGVTSERQQDSAYRLVVRFANLARPLSRAIELEPGESHVLHVRPPPSPKPVAVVATLYRRGLPTVPYRRVDSWVPGDPEASTTAEAGAP